jgi:hypothetical protein
MTTVRERLGILTGLLIAILIVTLLAVSRSASTPSNGLTGQAAGWPTPMGRRRLARRNSRGQPP